MSDDFSLTDDPCLSLPPADGGEVKGFSLLTALLRAHEMGQPVVALATQRAALLRQLLLAVVVDAVGRPRDEREWVRWFRAGRWSAAQEQQLGAYLDEHRARFFLFDREDPFGQVADLRTVKGDTKSAGLIVATHASGNNVPLFAARTEGERVALTPAEALLWLLHTQCWDTAAIKTGAVGDPRASAGKTTGNPTGPLGQMGVALLKGSTLYETLLLNIPAGEPISSADRPQWRRRECTGRVEDTRSVATSQWQERMPVGLLDLWTWQARRVRLLPEESHEGLRVTRALVCAGDRMPHTPDFEPHTMWRLEPTGPRAVATAKRAAPLPRRPLRLQPGKAAWRGLDALLATDRQDKDAGRHTSGFVTSVLLDQVRAVAAEIGEDYPLQVELTGIAYGTQSAVVEEVMADALPLPLSALVTGCDAQAAVLEVAEQAEQLAIAVNHLSADLRRAVGADPIPWDKGQRPGELVLHALDPLVRRLLAGIRASGGGLEEIEAGQLAWEQLAWRCSWEIADRLLRAVPVSAYAGRKVSQGEGKPERTYRVSEAEASFLRQRAQILHRWAAEPSRAGQGGAGAGAHP